MMAGPASRVRVKVCGVTTVADAVACVAAGVDSVGVNLVASSVRRVDEALARAVVLAIGARALVVAVVADMSVPDMLALKEATGASCLQLHGSEPAASVSALLPHAYKAVRVANEADVSAAEAMPGDYVLVDAKVEGTLGGTGHTFDWTLVRDLASRRRLVLAGGLTPGNVAEAIASVRPWCVDVASGVESAPGVKDMEKVRAFVEAARGASVGSGVP
jgi:phosphoribosylanthranilate isomerase